jgi:ubiquinone/menaquinone biosynthesis C-methylase UbiE
VDKQSQFKVSDEIICSAKQQDLLDSYFHSRAGMWKEIYEHEDVGALIHQQRRSIVLRLIDNLDLPQKSLILEVGCGAGLITVALAERGYEVHAVDSVQAMVDLTRQAAARASGALRVATSLGDAQNLRFPDNMFSVVLAIGVIPWLHSTYGAIQELARVTKPGGYIIVNADNRWRLNEFLDPARNPLHAPIRRMVRNIGIRLGRKPSTPPTQRHSPMQFDCLISKAGLVKVKGLSLGFGPFSLFRRNIFTDQTARAIHRRLQSLADRDVPLIRITGAQYIVLATKLCDV